MFKFKIQVCRKIASSTVGGGGWGGGGGITGDVSIHKNGIILNKIINHVDSFQVVLVSRDFPIFLSFFFFFFSLSDYYFVMQAGNSFKYDIFSWKEVWDEVCLF